jgi:hypothetical protein
MAFFTISKKTKGIFEMFKDIFGLSIAGKLKKLIKYYSNSRFIIFDANRVNCSVVEWASPARKYQYFASCYCDDSIRATLDNNITIFSSKLYSTRQEAEATMDIDIIQASKKFTQSTFYRRRYYPESDALGEPLGCVNGHWEIKENQTGWICSGCRARYSKQPEVFSLCKSCGSTIT